MRVQARGVRPRCRGSACNTRRLWRHCLQICDHADGGGARPEPGGAAAGRAVSRRRHNMHADLPHPNTPKLTLCQECRRPQHSIVGLSLCGCGGAGTQAARGLGEDAALAVQRRRRRGQAARDASRVSGSCLRLELGLRPPDWTVRKSVERRIKTQFNNTFKSSCLLIWR